MFGLGLVPLSLSNSISSTFLSLIDVTLGAALSCL